MIIYFNLFWPISALRKSARWYTETKLVAHFDLSLDLFQDDF